MNANSHEKLDDDAPAGGDLTARRGAAAGLSAAALLFAAVLAATLGTPDLAIAQEAAAAAPAPASASAPLTRAQLEEFRSTLERHMRQERGRLASLQGQVDVVTLHMRLSDIAHVDQVRFFGPASGEATEPRSIRAYVFVPKEMDQGSGGSLVVWQRGEDEQEIESWSDVPELRELLGRGVTIIAPDYDGAPEERLEAVTGYALDRYPFLDADRVEWRPPS
jgi:hypothetical protein